MSNQDVINSAYFSKEIANRLEAQKEKHSIILKELEQSQKYLDELEKQNKCQHLNLEDDNSSYCLCCVSCKDCGYAIYY